VCRHDSGAFGAALTARAHASHIPPPTCTWVASPPRANYRLNAGVWLMPLAPSRMAHVKAGGTNCAAFVARLYRAPFPNAHQCRLLRQAATVVPIAAFYAGAPRTMLSSDFGLAGTTRGRTAVSNDLLPHAAIMGTGVVGRTRRSGGQRAPASRLAAMIPGRRGLYAGATGDALRRGTYF